MKRLLLLLVILVGSSLAQNTPTIGVLPDNGPSLPATCVIGQIYFRTATTVGLNQCNPANTWTALATSSSASGTVSPNSGSAGAGAFYPSAAGSTTVSPLSGLTYDSIGHATLVSGTITSSLPFMNHTATWNNSGTAFTDFISNITCTAAATNSIAAGFGTGGTLWQFKYTNTNCTQPQFLVPDGQIAQPAYSFTAEPGTGILRRAASVLTFVAASNNNSMLDMQTGLMEVRSGAVYCWSSSSTSAHSAGCDTGISRAAAGVMNIGTGGAASKAGFVQSGNTVFVTSNFTTAANTNLQTITGLTWTFPALAANWSFHCHLSYSQATGTAAVAFGIQAATNAPTNIFATGEMFTAAGTVTTGTLATLTTTTATNIVSGTPGATATNNVADLYGTAELPASANTLNIMVSTATSGDAVTVLRGSYCSLTP